MPTSKKFARVRKFSSFLIPVRTFEPGNQTCVLLALAKEDRWSSPGGQLHGAENLWAGALREARSEVGTSLTYTLLSPYVALSCVTPQGQVLEHAAPGQPVEVKAYFLVYADEGEPTTVSPEMRTPMFLNLDISKPALRPSLANALKQYHARDDFPRLPNLAYAHTFPLQPDYANLALRMHAMGLSPRLLKSHVPHLGTVRKRKKNKGA